MTLQDKEHIFLLLWLREFIFFAQHLKASVILYNYKNNFFFEKSLWYLLSMIFYTFLTTLLFSSQVYENFIKTMIIPA